VVLTAPGKRRRMADVLIALGGNVGDVRATFQKAIANICGMAQAALLARPPTTHPARGAMSSRRASSMPASNRNQPRSPRAAVHAAQDRKKFGRDRAGETALGSAHPRTST
jgi:hypothetical protein